MPIHQHHKHALIFYIPIDEQGNSKVEFHLLNGPRYAQKKEKVFLQFLYGEGLKIVPMAVGRSDLDTCHRVGSVVAKAIEKSKQDIVILASTDMTHYGSMFYGFAPVGSGPIKKVIEWVYEMDGKIISAISELNTAEMLNLAKKTTMCGSIPVAITMEASRALEAKEVKKLKYSTSYDIKGSIDAIVGYLSVKITH